MLNEEVSLLKDKVPSIAKVVEWERREAVTLFQAFEDFLALRKESYDTGFKESYSKNFLTLSEQGWVNREKYFADMA